MFGAMTPIDTARRILALSAAATEGPWVATHDTPHPGACVSYVGDVWWVHGAGGRRGTPDDDAALIAESRAGAEELARFVTELHAMLTDPCPRHGRGLCGASQCNADLVDFLFSRLEVSP